MSPTGRAEGHSLSAGQRLGIGVIGIIPERLATATAPRFRSPFNQLVVNVVAERIEPLLADVSVLLRNETVALGRGAMTVFFLVLNIFVDQFEGLGHLFGWTPAEATYSGEFFVLVLFFDAIFYSFNLI